jgi:arylsulfatase A-like enzyme
MDKSYTPEGRNANVLQYNLDEQELKSKLNDLPGGAKHRYAGITNIDHQLGLIRRKLAEIGAQDNTVILFMSDHNIEPGKATSYEKGIHIPMIVHWPGNTTGSESASLISTIDVLPTLLDIAGIPIPDGLQLDGNSFLPAISDPSKRTREHIFAENGYTRAISDGEYKFIALRYPESLIRAMQENEIEYAPSYVGIWPQAHSAIAMKCFPHYFDQDQLYDLENDPYEQANINSAHPEVSLRLQAALSEHLNSFTHPFDLRKNAYLSSPDYRSHYHVNLEYDLANIPWLRRDHGAFEWPPE